MLLAAIVAATLSVGDVAPALPVSHWVQHAQAALPERGRVTVVEFWATWCGPCIANIPHLTALQKKYAARGVVVVGATSEDDWGNDRAAVEKLVHAKGAALDYAVVILPDSRDGKIRGIHLNPWFRAADVGWLPCAFVVGRDGKLAYIGDPMQIDDVIPALLDGTYDIAKARRHWIAASRARQMFTAAETAGRAQLLRTARSVIASDAHDDPHTMMLVTSRLSDSKWSHDRAVLDLAMRAAESAVSLTKRESPGMLDALARVWFLRGDFAKAAEIESLAVQKSEGPMHDAQLKNLEKYRAAR